VHKHFNPWVPISAQALELLSPASLLPSLRFPVKSYILPLGSVLSQLDAHPAFPSHVLRAQVCGRVGASGTFVGVELICSGEDRWPRFWGMSSTRLLAPWHLLQRATSQCHLPLHARQRGSALQPLYTASSRTTTLTSAMSTSTGLNASGYNLFRILVVVNIVYMFAFSVRSHVFMRKYFLVILSTFPFTPPFVSRWFMLHPYQQRRRQRHNC
jgi:hypothetical protein